MDHNSRYNSLSAASLNPVKSRVDNVKIHLVFKNSLILGMIISIICFRMRFRFLCQCIYSSELFAMLVFFQAKNRMFEFDYQTMKKSKQQTMHNFITNLYLWAIVICVIHRPFFSTWYGIWFPDIQIVFTSHQEPLIQLISIRVLERKILITIFKFPGMWKFWLTPTNTISTLHPYQIAWFRMCTFLRYWTKEFLNFEWSDDFRSRSSHENL